jgi:hypothetical protein
MTVSVVFEKPHSFWYTTYSGVGALAAAAKRPRIAVVAPNAIGSDRRPARPAVPSTVSGAADNNSRSALLSGEFAAGGRDDVGAGVGVSLQSPTTLGRLGDQNPRALSQLGIAGGRRDDVCQFPDHA